MFFQQNLSVLHYCHTGGVESGWLHRSVVRYKVASWDFSYNNITEEEKAYLESLFPDAPTFQFGRPDRLDTTKQAVTECYRSQYGISWRNARTGLWSGLKFQIIEV